MLKTLAGGDDKVAITPLAASAEEIRLTCPAAIIIVVFLLWRSFPYLEEPESAQGNIRLGP